MRINLLLCATLLVSLLGCAAPHTRLDSGPAFTEHTYESHDIKMGWKSEKKDSILKLTGTVGTNRYLTPLRDLEIHADALNGRGEVVAKGSYAPGPQYLGQPEPFALQMAIPEGETVELVRFLYTYQKWWSIPMRRTFQAAP